MWLIWGTVVFECDAVGEVARFRFNNTDRTSLCELSAADMERFYAFQPALDAAINHPANGLQLKVGA